MNTIDKWFDDQFILVNGRYEVSESDLTKLIGIVKDTICYNLRYRFEGEYNPDSVEEFIESLDLEV